MSIPRIGRRWIVIPLAVLSSITAVAVSTPAQAKPIAFFEERTEAFWAVPHQCADGSTASGTLLVSSTRDYEAPETEDPEPTARVQFLAVCADGASYSWGVGAAPATITSTKNLTKVKALGSGIARDIFGVSHHITFDVVFKGVGPVEVTRNGPGSKTKLRDATATGRVTFDGAVLFDGPSNHPTRPAPFIRVDTER